MTPNKLEAIIVDDGIDFLKELIVINVTVDCIMVILFSFGSWHNYVGTHIGTYSYFV